MMKTIQYLAQLHLSILMILLLGINSLVLGQNIQVSGQVTTEEDGPLPGVSVIISGTTIGTSTDVNGSYTLTVAPDAVLAFVYLGYVRQEIPVNARSKIDVLLVPDVTLLNEVVVTGYGVQEKREVTGAIAQVKGEDVERLSAANFQEGMQGMLPGVSVSSASGNPGDAPVVIIRGIGSILQNEGANEPLYVVDGIPFQGTPNISPNEIESIEVLKDAASAAIYGTRGSNGVILITTKQARSGEMKVDFNGYYGIQALADPIPLMNTSEQLYFNVLRRLNSGIFPFDFMLAGPRNSVAATTDWLGHFQNKSASVQNYNVGLSGGSKYLGYYINVNHFDQEGQFINSGFKRTSIRATTKFTKKRLNVNTTVNLQRRQQETVLGDLFNRAIRLEPFRGAPSFDDEEVFGGIGSNQNPLIDIARAVKNTNERTIHQLFGGLKAEFEILEGKGLFVGANLGASYSSNNQTLNSPEFIILDEEGNPNPSNSQVAKLEQRNTQDFRYTTEFTLRYEKKFKGGHKLNVLALYSREKFTRNFIRGINQEFLSNEAMVFDAAAGTATLLGNEDDQRLIGMLGRVQYNFKNKYLLSASVRRDGASAFPNQNLWGVFPSVSVGYNLHEEGFFRDLIPASVITTFKIRYGYGQAGNSRITSFAFIPTISNNVDYVLGESDQALALGATTTDIFNQNLRWETSIQNNLGFDLTFLNNQVALTLDLYRRKSEDLLFPVSIPGSIGTRLSGSSSVVDNIGDIENKGIELLASYRGEVGKLKFKVTGTLTVNRNKVLKMATEGQSIPGQRPNSGNDGSAVPMTFIREGYPVGSYFLVPYNGIISNSEDLEAARAYNPQARFGDLQYQDSNGDGVLNDLDRIYMGNGTPDFESGLNVSLGYKGFDLAVNFYGVFGLTLFNGAKYTGYRYGRHKDLINSWSLQNTDTDIFIFESQTSGLNQRSWSDYWFEDGDYIRVKNINFGYTLPKSWMEKAGLNSVRFYFSAINPFTFTKYTGYDPEVGGGVLNRGIDFGRVPLTKHFRGGLQMKF